MLRRLLLLRHHIRRPLSTLLPTRRRPPLSNFSTESSTQPQHHSPLPSLLISQPSPAPPPQSLSPVPSRAPFSLLLLSATLLSALAAAAASRNDAFKSEVYADLEQAVEKSHQSARRIFSHMRQTGAAAAVLWKSLASVLSSANHEVQKGFELRVAAFVADIAAANEARRAAIVAAGRGAVVDWLLETVAVGPGKGGNRYGTQAESARALAYLISDPNVCEAVLGRPHAVPNLLRFILSFQPKKAKKHKHRPLDGPDVFKGRSMLVAAIMDITTSNCDDIDRASFHPSLPANADLGDIAAALQVVEEGSVHFDELNCSDNDDSDNGDRGLRGIGIKVLGGTTVLGFSKADNLLNVNYPEDDDDGDHLLESAENFNDSHSLQRRFNDSFKMQQISHVSAPGLWDDIQREHIAVPFAAWALANWASSSDLNRSHIHELDRDGNAIMTALTAPERTVKWHGSLIARFLLEDQNLPLMDSVPDWSFSLLSTVTQASKNGDISLAETALSAFFVSVKRSEGAKKIVMKKGLNMMREATKGTYKHIYMQETLARALELLCTSDMHLSLEDSQKWAGILLRWIVSNFSSDCTRSSAIKILSTLLEDYGPSTIPISQGWLTILLTEVLGDSKKSTEEGSTPPKSDKVQAQIDQSNAILAAQVASQLSGAVVSLAGNLLQREDNLTDGFPLDDFLSLEPFSPILKNTNKGKLRKIGSADSAISTLKGIKALTELCVGDSLCQNKIVDFGALCLLRRYLLRDDYEKFAAIETYDASRASELQEQGSAVTGSASNANDPSSVRVPPTAHIRRHAARLLMILSILPPVKKAIVSDFTLCKWLEDCACGRVPCCNDLKTQSYARATLLNSFCSDQVDKIGMKDCSDSSAESGNQKNCSPHFSDMLFLLNPELPYWKCYGRDTDSASQEDSASDSGSSTENNTECSNSNLHFEKEDSARGSERDTYSTTPVMDVVFVHGLRGGPFKSWRIAVNKSSTTSKAGLVETIDQEAGKQGTCWPREWLAVDLPQARFFSVKYKTNLSQWTGASLPLQEVSSMLLQKLVAAGIGDRPVVFVTHSMGGLVVKQMLHEAKMQNISNFVNNTLGVVFYSCPHFGSKLADMPWRMGLVLRPAPSIGELRSGSPRLMELNEFLRQRYNKGLLKILSFSETQVTPIVEGYGGWAFRMEIVPIESAYPGFGEIIVLDATDHINSCKPVNRTDPSYEKTLDFLRQLKGNLS